MLAPGQAEEFQVSSSNFCSQIWTIFNIGQNMILAESSWNEISVLCYQTQPHNWEEWHCHPGGLKIEYWKESDDVVSVFDQGCLMGTSICWFSGPGMPQDSLKCFWMEGWLLFPPGPNTPYDLIPDKWKTIDGCLFYNHFTLDIGGSKCIIKDQY